MSANDFLIDDGIIAWFDGPEYDQVALEAMQGMARDVEDAARDRAPWQDISGDARAGLTARVEISGGDVVLTLFHTVDYGLWLEVIQNGRFASIMPTLEREAPRIFSRVTQEVAMARQGRD